MAATTGHSINTGPYGENTEIYSSLKLLHWLNLNCINHWKVLYKLCVFYVDRNSKMTTTAGHSFYIGPIGSFYNQVNDTGSWEPLVILLISVWNSFLHFQTDWGRWRLLNNKYFQIYSLSI
jgi:hypothetical protein